MCEVISILLARGGSKGIKNKNIQLLGEKPLIGWTIEASINAKLVDKTIVSTDSEDIIKTSNKFGAKTPFKRPLNLSQDYSSSISALIHAVNWMEKNENQKFKYILLLQPTSPFRTNIDIDNAIKLCRKKDADAVVSVCEAKTHPYLIKKITPKGVLRKFSNIQKRELPRQKLPKTYVSNGAIYLVKRDILLNEKTFYTNKTYPYIMPQERSIDIDTTWDLYVSNLLLNNKKNE